MNIFESELPAAQAFSLQSPIFDQIYKEDSVTQYKRKRVRDHVLRHLGCHVSILELNSGTGEDALFFAEQGHWVHATDISSGMQEQLIKKVKEKGLNDKITPELCSFTKLGNLKNKGPYDLIFSNFAGLNCTGNLKEVLQSFEKLVKPGGIIVLVILPKFCLWEFLAFLKGNFKLGFRRIFSWSGVKAHIEGAYFTCWYYNPSFIQRNLPSKFKMIELEGLCSLIPPSYFENFPKLYPKTFNQLKSWEEKLKSKRPWNTMGDYYIISFRKNS